jgi:hypothetical protein
VKNERSFPGSLALAVLFILALLTASLLACSAPVAAPADGRSAECPVCKHNGDLACLVVHLASDTPTCECAGRTYYFCSDECRADFVAHPERYARADRVASRAPRGGRLPAPPANTSHTEPGSR